MHYIPSTVIGGDNKAVTTTSPKPTTNPPSVTVDPNRYLLPTNTCDPSHTFQDIFAVHRKLLPEQAHLITDLPVDAGYQPEIDCEFPTSDNKPRIEHNIHQVWLTSPEVSSVPTKFLDNVKSFIKHNPDWTYYFWTNTTVTALLKERHPHLLPIYESFNEIVVKGDMIRYVILYEFGGLYADFDCVCHRPLDITAVKYPCLMIPEPFEHAAYWYHQPFVIINAIMMCRAKHPFLKQIVDTIPSRKDVQNIVFKLGPGFLTGEYRTYINNTKDTARVDLSQDSTTPYFYQGEIPPTHDDGVYIPNTRFFMDSPSPAISGWWKKTCKTISKDNNYERACSVVRRRGYFRKPGKYTFLEHTWTHTWSNAKKNNKYEFTSIRNLTSHLGIFQPKNTTL